jgi:hypothetical protein
VKVHEDAVKAICDDLNTLKQIVEANAPTLSPVQKQICNEATRLKLCLEKSMTKPSPQKSLTGGQGMFDNTVLRPNVINLQQQKKQNQLISALLEGNIELINKLESEGASLLHSSIDGIYPLAAAAYGTDLDLVKYVEAKLRNMAKEQWQKVDYHKAMQKFVDNPWGLIKSEEEKSYQAKGSYMTEGSYERAGKSNKRKWHSEMEAFKNYLEARVPQPKNMSNTF